MAAALRHHRIVGGDDAVHDALDVDIDTFAPGRACCRVIGEEGERHDAGIVDHHIDGAMRRDRMRDKRRHGGKVGDIGQFGRRLAAGIGDQLHRFGKPFFVDVAANDIGAARRGLLADQAPEAAGRTGDDDGLAFYMIGHSAFIPGFGYCSSRILREARLGDHRRNPGLRTVAPDLRARLQTRCVVERAGLDDGNRLVGRQKRENRRAAICTELTLDSVAAVAAIHVALEFSFGGKRCRRHDNVERKRGAALALAVLAVTDEGCERHGIARIGKLATEATAFEFRHDGMVPAFAISVAVVLRFSQPKAVMARFMRAIHVFAAPKIGRKTWMTRTSRVMTENGKTQSATSGFSQTLLLSTGQQ